MIGMIPAKIVAVLAVGGSIFYGMAHLRDRDVPDGVRSRLEGALVPAALRRSSSLVVLQRRAAENDTCASPTMIADCTLAPRAAGNGPSGAKHRAMRPKIHRTQAPRRSTKRAHGKKTTKGAGDWGRHHCRTQGRWRPNRALIRHMQGAGPAQSGGLQGGKGGPALPSDMLLRWRTRRGEPVLA
jgi:hypothetical protein